MAIKRWLGHAANVKQVDTITIANTWAQNDTVTLTIDGIDVVITIGTLVTPSQVATTIKQVFNGETLTDTDASFTPNNGVQTIGQFTEMVATVSSAVVTLTATVAGKPFTLSVTETTAGDGTATEATAIAATGSRFYNNVDNWSDGSLPADADVVVFDFGSVGPAYNLQTGAIQPATVYINQAFTGTTGLPEQNIDNPTYPYAEYRLPALYFDDNTATTNVFIGQGEGQGSSRLRIDTGTSDTNFYIYASGSREIAGVPPILLAGENSASEVSNFNGDVGLAFYGDEAIELAALRNGNGEASQAKTYCGTGCILSNCTVEMSSGELTTNSAISAVNMTGGEVFHQAGAITTLSIWGGEWRQRTGAAITTLNLGGLFDKSQNMEPLTITNVVQLYKGARLLDPHGTITFTAGFKLNGCRLEDVEIDLGFGRTFPDP